MGLDVGERRVGIAIADELDTIASPLTVVARRPGDLIEIRDLAQTRGVDRLVVGLPTGMSGREGPQAASVRAFAEELRTTVGPELRIEFWDERLSTAVAERALRERRTRKERRNNDIDAIAAAVILQGYLDANRRKSALNQAPNRSDAL
jgi:putative Holliday junction resolvase